MFGTSDMLDPCEEVVFFDAPTYCGQLQVRVEIDQPRHDERIREVQRGRALGMGHIGRGPDCGYTAVFINKNGPVENDGAGHRVDGARDELQPISARHHRGEPVRSILRAALGPSW